MDNEDFRQSHCYAVSYIKLSINTLSCTQMPSRVHVYKFIDLQEETSLESGHSIRSWFPLSQYTTFSPCYEETIIPFTGIEDMHRCMLA